MNDIKMLIGNWALREPMGVIWLALAAVLIFGVSFLRSRSVGSSAWSWFRSLIEALVKALVFAALVGMVYFLLNSSNKVFTKIYGAFTSADSISSRWRQAWADYYGGTIEQQELQVTQYVQVESTQEVRAAGSERLLYQNFVFEQPISETSITRFRGAVRFWDADPQHRGNTYNVYSLSSAYEYDILNPTDTTTRAVYRFPLCRNSRLYYYVEVKINGEEVDWQMENGAIVLEREMLPAQKDTISIKYTTNGMEGYLYRIPEPHEIQDFRLDLVTDTSVCCLNYDAQNESINLSSWKDGETQHISYSIEHAIMASDLGFSVKQYWPYAPYYEMTAALPYAPRAGLLFLPFAALTLIICGVKVDLHQLALLGVLFLLPFLVLMSGQVPAPAFIGGEQFAGYQMKMLPVLSLVSLTLAFLILRKTPRLPLTLVLLLMALAMGGYVFIGLLPDEQKRNAAETLIQACLIAYLFLLTLYTRLLKHSKSAT